MRYFQLVLLAALYAAPSLSPAAEPDSRLVTFNTNVRVDVDAAGRPIKVEAPGDLPKTIRDYIEKRVATWHYEPANQAGVAAAGTTYVAVNACAVPVQGGYHLGLDFNGNGPRNAGDQRLQPPQYPRESLRRGFEAELVVILDIATNGTARLSAVEESDVSRHGSPAEFEKEVRRWAKLLHFDPEQIAGQPVAGQVRVPVTFALPTETEWRSMRDDFQAKANASRECQLAQGDNVMQPIALESVIKVTPKPET